jgi:VanZ family protein
MLMESRPIKILVRGLAIAAASILILLTVVPAADRPETGIEHNLEHFGAFLLAGLLFAVGFEVRTRTMLLMSLVFAAMIECMQIPLPTRHARLGDFVVDAAGIWVGILLARLAQARLQRVHLRRANPAE